MPFTIPEAADAFLKEKLGLEDYVHFHGLLDGQNVNPDIGLDASIAVLGTFSVRLMHVLEQHRIKTIKDIALYDMERVAYRHNIRGAFMATPGLGKSKIDELFQALEKIGWTIDKLNYVRRHEAE